MPAAKARWATAQLLDKCRGLTDEQLDQQFDIGRTSLRDTLHHLIFVIGFWTSQMTGQPFTRRHQGKPSIVELFDLHERNHDAFDHVDDDVVERAAAQHDRDHRAAREPTDRARGSGATRRRPSRRPVATPTRPGSWPFRTTRTGWTACPPSPATRSGRPWSC